LSTLKEVVIDSNLYDDTGLGFVLFVAALFGTGIVGFFVLTVVTLDFGKLNKALIKLCPLPSIPATNISSGSVLLSEHDFFSTIQVLGVSSEAFVEGVGLVANTGSGKTVAADVVASIE
jgi:hypothetical protein